MAFQSEAAFENKDASPLVIDTDMLNNKRNTSNPIVGPFERIKKGKILSRYLLLKDEKSKINTKLFYLLIVLI